MFHREDLIKLKKTLDTIVKREEPNITEEEFKEIPRLVKSWYYKLENSFPILTFGLQSSSIPYNEYIITESLVAMYNNVKEKIEEIIIAKESQDQPTYHHFEFLILAHGHIVKDFLPSSDYYRYNIYDVRTFVPWGSILHASAAASILIGKAKPGNMSYVGKSNEKADVYALGEKVKEVTSFNVLPKDNTQIPTIILKPTDKTDKARIESTRLRMNEKSDKKSTTDDLPQKEVILVPYFNFESGFKYPKMPLHIVNNALLLVCDMLMPESTKKKVTCDIQGIHCLSAKTDNDENDKDNDENGKDGFEANVPVEVNQYYSTIPDDKVMVKDETLKKEKRDKEQNFQTLIEDLEKLILNG